MARVKRSGAISTAISRFHFLLSKKDAKNKKPPTKKPTAASGVAEVHGALSEDGDWGLSFLCL